MAYDYSISDAVDAEVIDESPTTVLVEFSDGSVESIDRNSTLGTLCRVEAFDASEPIIAHGTAHSDDATLETGGSGITVEFRFDPQAETATLSVEDGLDELTLTGNDLREALIRVATTVETDDPLSGDVDVVGFDQSDIKLWPDDATALYQQYESIIQNRVREDIVDQIIMDLGIADTVVEFEDEAYIVEDTYVLTMEAENYLVQDMPTYERSGADVNKLDSEPEAIGMAFDTDPHAVVTIGGEEYVLTAREQRLLASIAVLHEPEHYLGVESFRQEAYSAIKQAKGLPVGDIQAIAESVTINHYVDPETGLLHRHDIDKHVLRSSFKINRWVVDELHYNSWDHAGLAELAWREDEFTNADDPVFFDAVANDDTDRWQSINSTAEDAPCPPKVYRTLRTLYGS